MKRSEIESANEKENKLLDGELAAAPRNCAGRGERQAAAGRPASGSATPIALSPNVDAGS